MIGIKKIFKVICVSTLLVGISSEFLYIKPEATASILDVENKTGQDMIKEVIRNNSESNADIVSNIDSSSGLTPEDFIEEFEIPNKVEGDNLPEELLLPEDFLSKDNITIQDFEYKILERMLEVVSLLQTFSKPFCILLFIICGLGVLTSIVFGTNKQKMFMLGLILSVIAYVGIVFAPNLVLFFADWLSF